MADCCWMGGEDASRMVPTLLLLRAVWNVGATLQWIVREKRKWATGGAKE